MKYDDQRLARRVSEAAASVLEIDVERVFSRDTAHEANYARGAAMTAIRHQRGWTYPRIGAAFGRDHTSVHHLVGRTEKLIRARDEFVCPAIAAAVRACVTTENRPTPSHRWVPVPSI